MRFLKMKTSASVTHCNRRHRKIPCIYLSFVFSGREVNIYKVSSGVGGCSVSLMPRSSSSKTALNFRLNDTFPMPESGRWSSCSTAIIFLLLFSCHSTTESVGDGKFGFQDRLSISRVLFHTFQGNLCVKSG